LSNNYQAIADIADDQTRQITESMSNWTSFLATAGRLYKYPFNEQLLIHAQRPDAIACAPFDTWKKPMYRDIKKHSKGIALLDNTGSRPRLKYVYDVADTRDGRYASRSYRPFLWELKPEHETHVIASLEKAHGVKTYAFSTDNDQEPPSNPLGVYLLRLSMHLSIRFYEENQADILSSLDSSHLQGMNEFDIERTFTDALTISMAYAIMKRCGIDPNEFVELEDLQPVFDFNAPDGIYALGTAVSTVTEDILRGIEKTIKAYEREKSEEREGQHEPDNVHPARGVANPRHHDTRNAGTVRDIRPNVQRIPTGPPPGGVHEAGGTRETVSPLPGGREDSQEIPAAGQSHKPNGVDGTHEQSTQPSGKNTVLRPVFNQIRDIEQDTPEEAPFLESGVSAFGSESIEESLATDLESPELPLAPVDESDYDYIPILEEYHNPDDIVVLPTEMPSMLSNDEDDISRYDGLEQPDIEANTPSTPTTRQPMPGDKVYIHNKLYEINAISSFDVHLRDPAITYPVFMSLFHREFDEALTHDPRNAHLLPIVQSTAVAETVQSQEPEQYPEAPPFPSMVVADFVKAKLEAGEKFSGIELFNEATRARGDTMANNAFTSKDAYDAMELGVNQYMLSMDNISYENVMKALALLPTQTRRIARMEMYQQFSTPPSIAYLANWAANVTPRDIVLEPSAGIGGIAVFAKKDGATVYVNELDSRRLEIIKNLPFDGFYNEDAEQINNIHGDKLEPTVVVMNPPFSTSAKRNIHNTKIGARHIEEALRMLAPNGRLVAIVGQGMADEAPAFREWWREVKEQYNVKANIGIDGKNYHKYGTDFGVQLLVIDKNGPTIEPVITAFVESLSDLERLLEGVRNDRPSIQHEVNNGIEQNPIESTRTDTTTAKEPEHIPDDSISNPGGATDTATAGDRPEQAITQEVDAIPRGTPDDGPEPTNISDDGPTPILDGERHSGNEVRNDVIDGIGQPGIADNGQPIGDTGPRVKKELTDSIFENYMPQLLLLENVQPHPANISESAAMSAIHPPLVTYRPNLDQSIIDNGILSDVQLEAVTYAGQSHNQTLPNGNTRGFFLGDGTGVGKGRTITGVILDNFRQGRKKAVWLSENRGLVPDAKRDVAALFGNSDLVVEFEGGKKADRSLSSDEAILFATYSALSKGFDQSGSNYEKIIEWLGRDFDGVIVFDEAHNMANSTSTQGNRGVKKASQRGMAGLAIQEALPNAKIIYSSATGATEVENLRYAERLGLWGEGTAFPNGDNFVNRIKAGGLAAMELIARDMKAMGVYLSRNISYEDVAYDKIVHELTPEQRKIYDELARSWQIVLQDINKALQTTNQGSDGMAKGKAYGAFWSAQQRFFNQILTAMQVPSMIADMQKQLDDGNSIVVQLVSTNESAQEREFARLQEQDLELDDFDLTPKQMLMLYIENSFPIVQFEEYRDENGNLRSKPVFDSQGNPVINREAERQKEMLLDKLGSIKVPASALDMIINHFGSDMVAENTGRKRRVVIKDGRAREENIANKKQADVQAFQDGEKRIIVFSKAGGTGKSYHADKSAKNQQHRVHYLLQAGWQADAAVQGFGRSHRSNQVSAPTFSLVTTDLKGQMRFISTIAKRLDQLGALTKGQRQTGSQGLFAAGDNLENAFAADVLSSFYKALILNKVEGISDGVSIIEKLGLKHKLIDEYGYINTNAQELREVNKFLNRILSLECHEQNAVFDGYAERLHIATEQAMQNGTLDRGLENYKADKVVLNETQDISTDDATGATTKYYNLTALNKIKPTQFNEVKTKDSAFMGFYQSKSTGVVRAVFKTSSMTDEYGNVSENCRLAGQDGKEYMPLYRVMNNWIQLDTTTAEQLWNNAISELPEFRTTNLHLIGGTVLPVWDKLPTENVRIYRVLTTDGDMLIGRVIPEESIDATLDRLGAIRDKEKIETADLLKHIKNGDTVYLDNDWRIAQRRVSNEQRIEVIGPDFLYTDLLQKKGVFTERINYQTRYFIPAETDTIRILDEVIKISPVSRVQQGNDRTMAKPNVAKEKPSLLETLERNAEKSRTMFSGDNTSTQGNKARDTVI